MGTTARVPAIDMMRGFVIALMALDHCRDFFGPAAWNPEDLSQTTPAWFWTRWITHLCATTFVLLAGSSAFLRGHKTGLPALSRYLAIRGALLILLEMSWISFSWQFGFNVFIMQVIYALGASMIVLAALVWLPRWAIALIAAALILPHNLLDGIKSHSILWLAWHQQGFAPLPWPQGIVFMYPLMPWLGLMCAGYAIGPVFLQPQAARQKFLWAAAGVLLLVFVALRANNLYGDPDPWSPQGKGFMWDLISFVRVHKYPPSLLYLCVTGGIGLALLALFEKLKPVPMLMLFGRVPLFFYVIHISLTHFLGNAYLQLRFGGTANFGPNGASFPDGYAPDLGVVYLSWFAMLAIMYGLCTLWTRRGGARPALASA